MSTFKKQKLMSKVICTHSGSFHADEALAVYMLRLLPTYSDATLVRSRDPAQWEAADIVVDVSGQYDAVKFFDHHQRGFNEVFSSQFSTKLSSAGLVYKHFGKDIISQLVPNCSQVDLMYNKVYKEFIEALDANDNGISNHEDVPKFHDKNITLPGMISQLNPPWNEDCSDAVFDSQFLKASEMIGEAFVRVVKGYGLSWLPAKEIVARALAKRLEVDESGKIIVLDQFCPWKEHLYALEKENGIEGEIQFVLFQDSSKAWRVSTVSLTSTSFEFRRGLPENLRGLRDEELSKAAGIEGGIFIHAAGFIGGAKTEEGVLALARASL